MAVQDAVFRRVAVGLVAVGAVVAVLVWLISGPLTRDQTATTSATERYGLLDHPDWKLKRAIHYRAGRGDFNGTEPALEWFAEYEGPRVDNPDGSYTIPALRVSGHALAGGELGEELPGFVGEPLELGGRQALFAKSREGLPQVLVVAWATGSSVMLLTHDPIELLQVADALTPVDEEGWLASGGQIVDCVPLEDRDCIVEE